MKLAFYIVASLVMASPVSAGEVEVGGALRSNLDECRKGIVAFQYKEEPSTVLGNPIPEGAKSKLFRLGAACRMSDALDAAIGTDVAGAKEAGRVILRLLKEDLTLSPNASALLAAGNIIVDWPKVTSDLPAQASLGVNQGPSNPLRIGSVDNLEQAFREETSGSVTTDYTTPAAPTILPLAIYSEALNRVRTISITTSAIAQTAASAFQRDAAWRSYHFGGGTNRVQLPWEILVNDAILMGQPRVQNYRTCLEKSISDSKAEPCPQLSAPTSSLSLLHPSVGITPFNEKGNSSGVTGVIEVIGYNWWDYDQTTFARKNDWSVSLVGVYAQADNRDSWGPGILVRTPFSGVSIVWSQARLRGGGSSNALSFSVDIPGLLSSRTNEESLRKSLLRIFSD